MRINLMQGLKYSPLARDNFRMGRIGVSWLLKTKDQKIEDINKYFICPEILVVENLIKQTKNNIVRCGVKIGELQEIRNLEQIVVTKTKIKAIKAKIKEVQSKIANVKAKRRYKGKKLKRLLENEWQQKEAYLTDEEIIRYIRYGKKGQK